MKKYEAYKNSGVEWIGEIPAEWNVVSLKHYLSLKGRIGWNGLKSEEFEEESYAYLVTGQDFDRAEVDWSKCYQINKERYDEDPFIQLDNGDILVTKDGTIGKVAKVVNLDKPACLNSGIFVVKQKKGLFDQNYLYWILVSNQLKEFVGFNSTGSTIQHLYQNVFENMPLVVPSISEQHDIASYLDHKVGQIDASVSAINTQIEDLKAYRQSVISEAVTKGINPNAPMKNSDIEWIGEIPRCWDVKKLLNCIRSKVTDGPHETPNVLDNGIPFVSIDSLNDSESIDFSIVKKYISEEDYLEYSKKTSLEVNDILFSKSATIGKTAIVGAEKFMVWSPLAVIKPSIMMHYKYMYFVLSCNRYIESVCLLATFNTQLNVGMRSLEKSKIPVPPISEQLAIASYLDTKTSEIDAFVKSLETQRDDLNALKQSIISEAVTGKIDVRDWNKNN